MNKLQGELTRLFCDWQESTFYILNGATSFSLIYVPFLGDTDLPMGLLPSKSMTSLGIQTKVGEDIIYIARVKGRKRSVRNEKEVLSTIQKVWPNVKVVFPVNNWKINRKTFENAKVIIGPHGGAFGNMIFAPVNCTIIEFLPLTSSKLHKSDERPCYFGLAHALGFTYFALEPELFHFNKPMIMSISELEKGLMKAAAFL